MAVGGSGEAGVGVVPMGNGELCAAIARRFGCGIDEGLDAVGQTALAQLRGVTMRSIQRLAAELYGGDSHFLLE